MSQYTNTRADLSEDQRYRYNLLRYWGDSQYPFTNTVAFVGLNPSTADASEDDPTIRRCREFAKSWGMSGMWMVNLFAFRATDPKAMKRDPLPVGPRNNHTLLMICAKVDQVIVCWGNHGTHLKRNLAVTQLLTQAGITLYCLKRSKAGNPGHPLYLKADSERILFRSGIVIEPDHDSSYPGNDED